MNMIKALVVLSIVSLIGCDYHLVPAEDLVKHEELIDYLVIAQTLGGTPLHLAASHGIGDIAQLIADGAEVEARNDDGYTPLHSAAWSGTLPRIKALVKAGANTNAKDDWGRLPRHRSLLEFNRRLSIEDKGEALTLLGGTLEEKKAMLERLRLAEAQKAALRAASRG